MILQRLVEFSSRTDTLPAMYQKSRVRWLIDLDSSGRLISTRLVPLTGGDSRGRDRGKEILVPHIGKTSKIVAKLLADNAEYVLGAGTDAKAPARHKAFCDLIDHCAEQTKEPAVKAVQAFLKTHPDKATLLPQEAEDGELFTFRVDGILPVDLPEVRTFWAGHTLGGGHIMQCLICGKTKPVEERLPVKIKGIPGGQTSGTALVSANSKAFESYGLAASLVAPTCRECGEAFANSANYMIRQDQYHVRVGPSMYLFWTKEETAFSPANFLSSPQEEDVKRLIESCRTGQVGGADSDAFYALSLSASGGRVVIRDWLSTTVPTVQANLARWFSLQRLLNTDGTPGRPFGVYALAAALYLKPNDQMVANVPRVLVRCALYGDMLPNWLLAQAISRARADKQDPSRGREKVPRNRAALIKAVLLSQINDYKEDYMERLDVSCTSPGYLCGRLLAELEAAQKADNNPRATIVDRYYGAASSAPATVFGNLMRNNQAHMSSLRRDRPGVFKAIDRNIQEIAAGLKEFPKVLTLKDQALFALGYYHQKTARWAKPDDTNDQEEK